MTVIDEYIKDVSLPERAELERIRHLVHGLAPEAEEVITYGLPGFKYQKKYLVAFASFKDHLSIFPASHAIEVLQDKLSEFTVSKGTVQFTVEKPLPDELIRELVTIRLNDIENNE